MTAENVLEIEDLTVTFDGFTAVDGLSFGVELGETLAVVGESGSGKSVTALAVMGLLEPNATLAGRIWYRSADGTRIDLASLPDKHYRRIRGNDISMIFQEPMTSLNPVLTVGEQIAEAIRLHTTANRREAMARTVAAMDLVRIPDARRRSRQYPHEMSGGMRQRVMIAMAMACEPRVLIADEPTTALDVTIQAQILDLIADLQESSGASVLLITHDMGVVAEVADRVLVMQRSRLVEQGPVIDLFQRPTASYTRSLLAAVPRLGSMAGLDRPQPFPLGSQTQEIS